MTSWFRSWHGAPTDTKWLSIARRAGVAPGVVSAVAWALLDYASQHQDRGCIDGFDIETYSAFSGFDEDQITAVIDAMTAKGMIENDRWASWDRRQPEREDNSIDRVRRYRESRTGASVTPTPTDDVTHGNALKRSVTHGNAPDTDTDTDTEERDKRAIAPQPAKTPLAPCTPADDMLFDALSEVHPSAVPFKREFSNTKQAAMWHEVADAMGMDEARRCVDWCIANQRTTIGKIISSAQTWHNNNRKAQAAPGRNVPNGRAAPNGLPSPEMVWGVVQAEIDRVHYSGTPNLPAPILAAVEAVGGWYAVCKSDPAGAIPARLRDAYRAALSAA